MDFEHELEELIKDYLAWGSEAPADKLRADVIRVLEEQLAILRLAQ
jgi:hypothetical protein